MNNLSLPPRVNAAATSMRLHVAAPSSGRPPRLDGGKPAVTVASLRAVRKHHFVRLTDPASCVVTDFAEEQAFTIADDRRADDASIAMFRWGVQTLLTLREDGIISGLLSSENIEGERIQRFLERHPDRAPEDIRVRDLLTPCEELPAIDWERIRSAPVSDLLRIIEASDCGYLLVLEATGGDSPVLRGLVSRVRLLRQLGPAI